MAIRADVVDRNGRVTVEGIGNGPLDAFVSGLAARTARAIEVLDYHEHAVGGGAQARAAAYLEVRVAGGPSIFGVGIDANIVHASIKAVLSGVMRSDPNLRASGALFPTVEPLAA